ncbi:MAG: TIGR00730 family Rossman fold protein [Ruminococcus sp.]|nr:TIGR00730 family Rossman fold protein [Candidatus Copronaster equi]
MNICVYGASSKTIDNSYIQAGIKLGKIMADNGLGLVFGGGATGLMGAVARGMYENNGKIIGVAPKFFNVDGVLFENCTEFIYSENMRERKQTMEEISDAFIVTPGGIGTLDEFFEILTLKQLGRHNKPIALYNTNNYYDNISNLMNNSIKENFMSEQCKELFFISDNPSEIIDYIKNYKAEYLSIQKYKDI